MACIAERCGDSQARDPLIAAADGQASTPAYRGIAYAVFEDFQLGDYGNRISSLTFEVTGDEGGTASGAIVETNLTVRSGRRRGRR